jgi:hypothetical protein
MKLGTLVGGKALLLFDYNARLVLISMLMFVCKYSIQYGYAAAGRDVDGLRDLSYAGPGMVKEFAGVPGVPGAPHLTCRCPWSRAA